MAQRKTYPQPAEDYITACEKAMQGLGFEYKGKGCPCNGSPLVYETASATFRVTVYPVRRGWRMFHNRHLITPGLYSRPEQITTTYNQAK